MSHLNTQQYRRSVLFALETRRRRRDGHVISKRFDWQDREKRTIENKESDDDVSISVKEKKRQVCELCRKIRRQIRVRTRTTWDGGNSSARKNLGPQIRTVSLNSKKNLLFFFSFFMLIYERLSKFQRVVGRVEPPMTFQRFRASFGASTSLTWHVCSLHCLVSWWHMRLLLRPTQQQQQSRRSFLCHQSIKKTLLCFIKRGNNIVVMSTKNEAQQAYNIMLKELDEQ